MAEETTIVVNIKVPTDAPKLIFAIQRTLGYFCRIVNTPPPTCSYKHLKKSMKSMGPTKEPQVIYKRPQV